MENTIHSDELQHWGIKGQRWGIRRYQNSDGSLTPAGQKRYNKEMESLKKEEAKIKAAEKVAANHKKTQAKFDKLDNKKQELEERKKALKDAKRGKNTSEDGDNTAETLEERRERLLKSTDPKELYKNKDILSSYELNERINRIDLETRLQGKIVEEHKKTGMDYMESATNAVNKATNMFRTIDNAYSTVANSAIGKTIAKKLGIETPKKEFNLDEFVKNINTRTAAEIKEAKERVQNSKYLSDENNRIKNKEKADAEYAKKAADNAKAAKKAEQETKKAQKQVDDYNERWQKGESDDKVTATTLGPNGPYSYKKGDAGLSNGKYDTRTVTNYPAVIGNTSISNISSTKDYSTGQNYYNSSSSKVGTTRMSDADVEVIPPDWYTKMKDNGQI